MGFTDSEIAFTIIAVTVLFFLLSSSVIIYGLIYQKRRKQHTNQMTNLKHNYEQSLLQTQLEIQEQTLNTISQEIHDNIGQILSLAKLNLNTFPAIEDAAATAKLISTKDLVAKAIRDLRDLTRSMHSDRIAELGLIEATANELKILQNSGQYKTQLKITGQSCKLDPQKEMVLFRILQEALHNCVKHAKCKTIEVSMQFDPRKFILTISDDGDGFNMDDLDSSQKGIGLKSMYSRAVLINAVIAVNSIPGNGTTINLELIT